MKINKFHKVILKPISSLEENVKYAIRGYNEDKYCSVRENEKVLCIVDWY